MKDNKLNEDQKIKKDYGRAGQEILNIINKNKK